MKVRSLLLGLLILLPVSMGYAFTEYFQLSGRSPLGSVILDDIRSTGRIYAVKTSDRSFYMTNTHTGERETDPKAIVEDYVTLKVGVDKYNYCSLSIRDKAVWWTPEVTATCIGDIHYKGLLYQGLLTYRYELDFTK